MVLRNKVFLFLFLFLNANFIYGENLVFTFTGTILKEDLKVYLQWKEYIEKKSDFKVDIQFARTYAEAASNIKDQKTDIAYVCNSTYAMFEDYMSLLAIPIVKGGDIYYANIISLKNAPYRTLLDFKEKAFAFTDHDSTSGSIAPKYFILQNGYDINHFFHKLIYTNDHGEAIEAVLDGFVDGASVDSLVFSQFARKYPKESEKLQIIQKLGPFTISPMVIREGLEKEKFERLQKLFIDMNKDVLGKTILDHLQIDKFVLPKNQSYTKTKQMIQFIKER